LANRAELSKEERDWFIKNVTQGVKVEGPTLLDIGATPENFTNPIAHARGLAKDHRGSILYLQTILKMFKLAALATLGEPWSKNTRVFGQKPIFVKSFIVENKEKPRLVTNYAEGTNLRLSEDNLDLQDWLQNPEHQERWDWCKGRPSYNTLIDKVESTLSYVDLRDNMAFHLAFCEALFGLEDLKGSYYQIRQHESRVAFQMKPIHARAVDGLEMDEEVLPLMTREMGDGAACAVGNTDTGIKLKLFKQWCRETDKTVRTEYDSKEYERPERFGLVSKISEEVREEIVSELSRKKRNRNGFMHYRGEIFLRYRLGKSMPALLHFQDDIKIASLEECDPGRTLRHAYSFFKKANIELSTEYMEPMKSVVFCGLMNFGQMMSFEPEKWEKYRIIVEDFLERLTHSGAQLMALTGTLCHIAYVFTDCKAYVSVLTSHLGSLISLSTRQKGNMTLQGLWKRILKASYEIDGRIKRAVKEGWDLVYMTKVHARDFLITRDDAKDDISIDACPYGVGLVNHRSQQSYGGKWNDTAILKNRLTGDTVPSTCFEITGVAVGQETMDVLQRDYSNEEWSHIIALGEDNSGAVVALHPCHPKFRKDYVAANMLIQRVCKNRNFKLIPYYLNTDLIPADAPSRLYKSNARKDLIRRIAETRGLGFLKLPELIVRVLNKDRVGGGASFPLKK